MTGQADGSIRHVSAGSLPVGVCSSAREARGEEVRLSSHQMPGWGVPVKAHGRSLSKGLPRLLLLYQQRLAHWCHLW